MAIAEPLLWAVTPVSSDPHLLIGVALGATRIMAPFIPGTVQTSNLTGILLAQSGQNMWLLVLAYGIIAVVFTASAACLIGLFVGSGCEDEVIAANASAYAAASAAAISRYHAATAAGQLTRGMQIFDEEAFVCSTAGSVLRAASWLEVACTTLGAAAMLVACFVTYAAAGRTRDVRHAALLHIACSSYARAARGGVATFHSTAVSYERTHMTPLAISS
jgi:hypothetical protein